ncbi:MAG: phosphoribosyltransferase [Candidatus Bathyarchaeia archaeon]|nr:phosphoribosyltransferase [Candidatus Bathyarchaeota archaeon]
MEFLIPDWNDIYEMCIKLADKIKKSGFFPDLIIGVARGGWIPARILSDLLENSNVASVRVEFYVDIAKTSHSPKITQGVSVSLTGRKILVVDDVADTGKSLKAVIDYLYNLGAKEVKTATLHYKPKSIIKPDFYIEETDAWIVYPHERFEFIKSIVKKLKSEGKTLNEIKLEVENIGLPKTLVNKFVEEIYYKL